jgi:TolA-binding protein
MVDHNDEFGSSAPPPGGGSEYSNHGEPNPGGGVGEPSSPAGELFEGYGGEAAHFKHPHTAPQTVDDTPGHPLFPMVLGGVMLLSLVAAWIANSQKVEAPAPASPAVTTAAPEAEKPATPDPEAESKALKGEIDGLRADLKALQDRIEALPKPAPAPDLGPLNSKLADLSKETEALTILPKKVDDLDQRLGSFDKTLVALRGDLDTLKTEIKKPVEPAVTTPEPAKPDDAKVADAALDQGAGLFKAGKYKEASEAFQKLTEASPTDARVWYFAALSRGSATNQWTGETTKLAEKGVELEKAGSPDGAKIDAAFAELNPAFKPWFDYYRKLGKAR